MIRFHHFLIPGNVDAHPMLSSQNKNACERHRYGRTAMHVAAATGSVRSVRLLAEFRCLESGNSDCHHTPSMCWVYDIHYTYMICVYVCMYVYIYIMYVYRLYTERRERERERKRDYLPHLSDLLACSMIDYKCIRICNTNDNRIQIYMDMSMTDMAQNILRNGMVWC